MNEGETTAGELVDALKMRWQRSSLPSKQSIPAGYL